MKFGVAACAALAFGMAALPALANRVDTLYSYKSWQVEGVTFDDDTYACLAEVTDPGESFSIWVFPNQAVRLQFYSEDWNWTEDTTADLQIEIDRRGAWTVPGATLSQNSVLYDLTDQSAGADFIVEVARGKTLHLRESDGSGVKDYSLAGSAASISKLIDCGTAISGNSNPFN